MKRNECAPVLNRTSFIAVYFVFLVTIANANCSFGWSKGCCRGASGRFLDDEITHHIKIMEIFNSTLTSLTANDFNRLTKVDNLKINASSFLDPPEIELLGGLKNLKFLEISSSTIAGDASAIIGNNTRLEVVSMSGNCFTSVKSSLSWRFPRIEYIDLSFNNISDIDLDQSHSINRGGVFSHLLEVTEINLQNNKITHIQNGTFMNLTVIRKVDLSFNMIHEIEPAALNFSSANGNDAEIVLNVSFNALWTVKNKSFYLCSRVKELDLMRNNISSLHIGAFHGLRNMKKLNLRGNTIVEVLYEVFPKNNSLEFLDMGNNAIQHIGKRSFEELKSLKELYLEKNKLTSIDITFLPLSNLKHLNLRGNQISHVPRAFYGSPKLEDLDLSENIVTQVEAGAFADNVGLQKLLLQGNALQTNSIDCVFLFNGSSAILHGIHKYIPGKNSTGSFNDVEVRLESRESGKCICVFFTGQHRDNHGPPQRYLSADGCKVENIVWSSGTEASQITHHREDETTIEATNNSIDLHDEKTTPSASTASTNQRTTEKLVDQADTTLSPIAFHREQDITVEATTNGEELLYEEVSFSATIVFPNQRTTERLVDQTGTSPTLKHNPSLLSGLTASHITYSISSGVAIVVVMASVMCLVLKQKRTYYKKKNATFEHVYEEIDETTRVSGDSSNAGSEECCTNKELEILPPEVPPRPSNLQELTEDGHWV